MWKTVTALVAVASLAVATGVKAEEWPTRPVTMINPFAAGGPNDVLARLFAQRMGEVLRQPIVLENIGGAGGMNGADRVASGRVDYLCDIVTTAKPQIDGGAVKAIAILTKERSPVLPNVPTAIEQGFEVEAYTWNAFFLPKATPDAIVQKLNHATVEAMKTPAVREKLESAGLKFVSDDRTTPEYLAKFVQSEIAKWAVPIKASGVSVD